MADVVIETKNLIKDFTLGKRNVRVLKGVNIKVNSGEYIILYGPSGSGKTTMLNMIAGLDRVTGGKVLIRGEDIAQANSNDLARHRLAKIGMVFQDFNLIQAMTALDNVAMPMIFNSTGLKQRLKRAKNLLSEMGLENRIDHKPIELSGGEQQRVAIARALINNPWILLIDEPTGNLDSHSANEIMNIITNLNKKSKRTVVLVTHNPSYLSLADRVIYMADGQVVSETRNAQ
jgi:putative ABC transport system ATP-binding protein